MGMHLSSVARLPLALIVALSMLIATVSTVAAAPSSGSGGGSTTLASHADDCDINITGGVVDAGVDVAALLAASLLTAEQIAQVQALVDLALFLDTDLCVDLTTLEVDLEVCISGTFAELQAEVAALAGLRAILGDVRFEALLIDLLANVEGTLLAPILGPILGGTIDPLVAHLLLDELTIEQLLGLVVHFGSLLTGTQLVCVPVELDLGDIIVIGDIDVDLICVEIGFIHTDGSLELELIVGTEALFADLQDALLAVLLGLDLEIGDVVCVAFVPVPDGGGGVIIVPVVFVNVDISVVNHVVTTIENTNVTNVTVVNNIVNNIVNNNTNNNTNNTTNNTTVEVVNEITIVTGGGAGGAGGGCGGGGAGGTGGAGGAGGTGGTGSGGAGGAGGTGGTGGKLPNTATEQPLSGPLAALIALLTVGMLAGLATVARTRPTA